MWHLLQARAEKELGPHTEGWWCGRQRKWPVQRPRGRMQLGLCVEARRRRPAGPCGGWNWIPRRWGLREVVGRRGAALPRQDPAPACLCQVQLPALPSRPAGQASVRPVSTVAWAQPAQQMSGAVLTLAPAPPPSWHVAAGPAGRLLGTITASSSPVLAGPRPDFRPKTLDSREILPPATGSGGQPGWGGAGSSGLRATESFLESLEPRCRGAPGTQAGGGQHWLGSSRVMGSE